MSTPLPALAFAGIGLMGLPMTQRLLAAGYPLTVWNRSADKCAPVQALGAQVAAQPSALCAAADIVMLCLANTDVVREVVFGPGGIVETGKPGQLLVDFSSLEPAATREMAAELHRRCGMRWVDAPVSGGTPGAANGTLAIMAGGRVEDIERVRPVLFQKTCVGDERALDRRPFVQVLGIEQRPDQHRRQAWSRRHRAYHPIPS